MSKQSTLSGFGFNGSATSKKHAIKVEMKVAKSRETPRQLVNMKDAFYCDGKDMNKLGTTERGIKIDGSAKEYAQKCERIISWSKTRPKFDIITIDGIRYNANFRLDFTSNQRNAIDNVYYRCKVFADF